jgi:hypothetical protein
MQARGMDLACPRLPKLGETFHLCFQYRHRIAITREIREMLHEALRMGISSDEGTEIYAEQSLFIRNYTR